MTDELIATIDLDGDVQKTIEDELQRHNIGSGATSADEIDVLQPHAQFSGDTSADLTHRLKAGLEDSRRTTDREVTVVAVKLPLDMLS
jgi:hypothetical protein